MKNGPAKNVPLYLASQSKGRRRLLEEAGYTFKIIANTADESSVAWQSVPINELTVQLAELKMDHVSMPAGAHPGEQCCIITADTLGADAYGWVQGKPRDFAHAVAMLRAIRQGSLCGSGFCVEKRAWIDGAWQRQERLVGFAQARIIFDVPDAQMAHYFKQLNEFGGFDYLTLSGGFTVHGYGAQFVKEVHGSYTAIIGLPMYEIRCALEQMGVRSRGLAD